MALEHYVDLPNGETLFCVESGKPEDPVILVIHGNYGSYYGMRDFLTEAPKGYRTIIPDLRGFGRSTYNHPYSTIKEMSDDLILFCNVLDIKKAIVVGHSLGGAVAMQFAADAQDITAKLILIAPSSVYGYPLFKGQAPNFAAFKDMDELMNSPNEPVSVAVSTTVNLLKSQNFDAYLKVLGGLGAHDGEPTEEFKQFVREAMMQRDLLAADWALMTWNITNVPSLYSPGANRVKDILAPTLLITADNDAFVLPFMNQANIDALSWKDNFIHVQYSPCSHMVYNDEAVGGQKKRFFRDYRSYIETGKLAD